MLHRVKEENKCTNRVMNQLKILLFISALFFSSCKKELKENQEKVNLKTKAGYNKIAFDFPDTIFINEKYDGQINYKNILDTITTSLENPKKYRSIYYYCLKTKSIYKESQLKLMITDSLITDNNRNIPLFDISFDKLGVNYLDGIIEDKVMIDTTIIKNRKKEPYVRVITNQFRATKKVVVIDKK